MDKEHVVHIYSECYSAIKQNEILPFAATRMNLEGTVLSEMSQTEKDKYCMIPFTCTIKKNTIH